MVKRPRVKAQQLPRLPRLLPAPHPPARRRRPLLLTGLLAGLLTAAIALAGAAGPAHADCKLWGANLHTEDPHIDTPGTGDAGFFDWGSPGHGGDPAPPAADPWDPACRLPATPKAKPNYCTTIYEQYGYAGLRWDTYDLGCVRNPYDSLDSTLANWLFDEAKAFAALAGAISQAVSPPRFLNQFDPAVTQVTNVMFTGGFLVWAGLSIGLLGVWVIILAGRGDLAAVVRTAGWALIALTAVGTIQLYPITAGHLVDQTVTETISRLNAGFTGRADITGSRRAHTALIHESVLYGQWLRGEFGNPDSDTARTYGPRLFKASALTWRENQLKGDARKMVINTKIKQWKQVAAEVKKHDPQAYRQLKGETHNRLGAALLAWISILLLDLFDVFASVYLMYALYVVRAVVMVTPLLAVVGLWLPGAGVLMGAASFCGRALLRATLYSAATGIGLILTRYTLGSRGLPVWFALLVCAVGYFALFIASTRVARGHTSGGHGRWLARSLIAAIALQRVRRRLGGGPPPHRPGGGGPRRQGGNGGPRRPGGDATPGGSSGDGGPQPIPEPAGQGAQ